MHGWFLFVPLMYELLLYDSPLLPYDGLDSVLLGLLADVSMLDSLSRYYMNSYNTMRLLD
jgi:hypothetical protein|uniref:Uncharacterized protein n=1 Tax=Picea glauca TaxID=3330 RepID=A0A101LW69_PICGL|nr:hypothetical protein ABT39_MTgene1583 [Picea glauca]QHR88363.1 hypothetical protein Q903MT_gene2376 [Picea sitchensis]